MASLDGTAQSTTLHDHSDEKNSDEKHVPSRMVADERKGTVVIKFDKPDPENPFDWQPSKKWITILVAELYSAMTAINATAYGEGSQSMMRDLHCSQLAVTSGTTSYLIVCAFAPLILAPVSEQFGRRGMMLISSILFTLCYLPQALANNIVIVVVFRGLQGAAASAANSLVGGVVADVFQADVRGKPMTMFSLFILGGQGIGAVVFGWVEQFLGFRWIAWINMIIAIVMNVAIYYLLIETRGSAILEARAKRLTAATGVLHIAEMDTNSARGGVMQLIAQTASRPIVFLCTEPVVTAMSLWAALLWGTVFLFFSSIPLVFAQYNFTEGETGSVSVSVVLGACLGVFASQLQERLYQRDARKTAHGRPPPESRLYGACIGGIVVPLSLFWFAWTGRPNVHWIAPVLAILFFNLGIFPVYTAVFSYLADAYEQYGSSAIAAQSFLRNVFAGSFPLFTDIMYRNLTYPVASTVLGGLALAFSALPFLLIAFGPRIRKRSRVARQIALQQEWRAAEHVDDAAGSSPC